MDKLYFYHGVPEDLRGNHLMPLNMMTKVDAELSDKYLEKYKGREEILERKIPLLDCLWNDVVQLLPLLPRKLFELQRELGLIIDIPNYRYFQIDPNALDLDRTVVFFKTAPGDEHVTVKWLRDVDLAEIQDIPPATRGYYESMVGTGEAVFNYQFVPHIVYRGTIDISEAKTIGLRGN